MTFDEVEKVLWDGTRDTIEALSEIAQEIPLSYVYSEKASSFRVIFGSTEAVWNKLHEVPNCVEYFGPVHDFAA